MDVTKPYEFIGFGAMDVTKPYEFIGFGAMDVTKPYEFIGFGAGYGQKEARGASPHHHSSADPERAARLFNLARRGGYGCHQTL